MRVAVILVAALATFGCSSLGGSIASSALGVGGTTPPIDVTAQIGAENESNKLKLSSDNTTKVDDVAGDMNNTTTINMTWWMILIVWLSGIVVNPANLKLIFKSS